MMATRSNDLADRLLPAAKGVADLAATLTTDEWQTPLPGDRRTVGVVVPHVASVCPIAIGPAPALAGGKPVRGVRTAEGPAMNAGHAADHGGTTREEAMALLLQNSASAAAAMRALDDAALDSAAPASLYAEAPITSQFMLEDHAVRHSYHHTAKIKAILGR